MKKFVSFFGERSPLFEELNEKTRQYAAEKGIEYVWVPQSPYNVGIMSVSALRLFLRLFTR